MTAAEHMHWLSSAGSSAYRAAYERIGLIGTPCGVIDGQVFAWTQKPINQRSDLKTLRIGMMAPGLSAAVLLESGAQVRASSPAALHVMALSGALNAVSLGPYRVDLKMRTHQVAGHVYAPNPLARAAVPDLIFSLKRWKALSNGAREAIQSSCDQTIQAALSSQAAANPQSLEGLAEDAQTFQPLPDAAIKHLFEAWRRTAEKLAAANPGFAAAVADYPWPKAP